MKIVLGSDHGGYEAKNKALRFLQGLGHEVVDFGCHSPEPVDYPDVAQLVAESVARREFDRGVLFDGFGGAVALAANKVPGARAGLCHDTFSARQGVEDDDVNVLCLGARVVGESLALEIVSAWLAARFSGAERHRRRLEKVFEIERRYSGGRP